MHVRSGLGLRPQVLLKMLQYPKHKENFPFSVRIIKSLCFHTICMDVFM